MCAYPVPSTPYLHDALGVREWVKAPGGAAVATNQILYNLTRRGPEWDLIPWLRERRIPLMAYSPIEQARLTRDRKLIAFAEVHGMTSAQAALAWLLAQDDVIVIPKASRRERVTENAAARDIKLSAAQLAELDRLFAPPRCQSALEML